MTPSAPDPAVIQRRLREIREVLQYFSTLDDVTGDELTTDIERRMAVERGLTHVVDLAVKINSSLVSAVKGVAPADYHRSFTEAGEIGVIPVDLGRRLAPSAGLRNRLVHEYDSIDYSQVARAIGSATRDYGEYVSAVASYIAHELPKAGAADDRAEGRSPRGARKDR